MANPGKERIVYQRGTEELRKKNIRAHKLVQEFNRSDVEDFEKREILIQELFGSVGENVSIEHNFHCDLGYNIHVGKNFYAGYNCTILDIAEVRIGDDCMIGPNVGIYTAGHSIEPKDRNKSGYAIPIKIGNNVWIGGNCVILPGTTIGDNSIIAAGSVVTKDVPPNTVAVGNPAKPLKTIE
ncbi:sugar O-acetyltransferase [Bacillus sp. CGMCC 1.60114]|uniref:sugar O-acetyltransferase n=1 Tax=unclassified Bacillus (in: firmicutes) TaxID=185979 RepID=UPI0036405960